MYFSGRAQEKREERGPKRPERVRGQPCTPQQMRAVRLTALLVAAARAAPHALAVTYEPNGTFRLAFDGSPLVAAGWPAVAKWAA